MDSKKQWTKDECSNLIEMYRHHTNLWDTKCIDYKNRYKRQDSLKEISSTFKTSSDEIDRKIKNLISQYNRERRKQKSIKKSGAGHSGVPKWFGYDGMSFLCDKNKPRKGRQGGFKVDAEDSDSLSDSGLNDTQSTTCYADVESGGGLPEMPSGTIENQIPLYDEQPAVGTGDQSLAASKATAKKPKVTSTSIRQEAFDMMKAVYTSRKTKEVSTRDDCEVFGELVGRKIRNLKTVYAKATVQHLINNILYDGEVGKYDAPVSINYDGTSTSTFGSPTPLFIDKSNSETAITEDQMTHNLNTSSYQKKVPQKINEDHLVWAVSSPFRLNPEK